MRSPEKRCQADEICVDRGCDKQLGQPCQNCIDEDASIPMVLRPSVPEDFKDPTPHPPYAQCVGLDMDSGLPENAGRYPAPVPFDSTTDTAKYLADLRASNGLRRKC